MPGAQTDGGDLVARVEGECLAGSFMRVLVCDLLGENEDEGFVC